MKATGRGANEGAALSLSLSLGEGRPRRRSGGFCADIVLSISPPLCQLSVVEIHFGFAGKALHPYWPLEDVVRPKHSVSS